MDAAFLAGLALVLGGCLAFYLAAPNQRWRARPLPARPARVAAALLLAGGLLALLRALQAVPAVFVLLTWMMLLWVLLPYLGALLPRKEGR